jgi:hypothetical protein
MKKDTTHTIMLKVTIDIHKKHINTRIKDVMNALENKKDYLMTLNDLFAGYSSLIYCIDTLLSQEN